MNIQEVLQEKNQLYALLGYVKKEAISVLEQGSNERSKIYHIISAIRDPAKGAEDPQNIEGNIDNLLSLQEILNNSDVKLSSLSSLEDFVNAPKKCHIVSLKNLNNTPLNSPINRKIILEFLETFPIKFHNNELAKKGWKITISSSAEPGIAIVQGGNILDEAIVYEHSGGVIQRENIDKINPEATQILETLVLPALINFSIKQDTTSGKIKNLIQKIPSFFNTK